MFSSQPPTWAFTSLRGDFFRERFSQNRTCFTPIRHPSSSSSQQPSFFSLSFLLVHDESYEQIFATAWRKYLSRLNLKMSNFDEHFYKNYAIVTTIASMWAMRACDTWKWQGNKWGGYLLGGHTHELKRIYKHTFGFISHKFPRDSFFFYKWYFVQLTCCSSFFLSFLN